MVIDETPLLFRATSRAREAEVGFKIARSARGARFWWPLCGFLQRLSNLAVP